MSGPAVLSPAPRALWRAAVEEDRGALPEHGPEWTDALCATRRYSDASRLYRFADGRRAVLPLVARRGAAGVGGRLDSYPSGWGIGGIVGPRLDAPQMRVILADLRSLGAQQVGIRPDPTQWPQWSTVLDDGLIVLPRRGHVLDLSGGADTVWNGFAGSARTGVRKAERAGVSVELGRSGALMAQFYELYRASVRRWARNQHEPRLLAHVRARRRDPLSKQCIIAEHLGRGCVIAVARLDGDPVCASMLFLGNTAHGRLLAMDRGKVGASRAGELVMWSLIRLACEEGCSSYHMGESGRSPALARFKEKFGARPYDYGEIRFERMPWTRMDTALRSAAKLIVGFRDV